MKRKGLFLAGLLAVFLPAAPAISQTYGGAGGQITAPGVPATGQPSSPETSGGMSGDLGSANGRVPSVTEREEGRSGSVTEGRESREEEFARREEPGERPGKRGDEREMTPGDREMTPGSPETTPGSPDAAAPGADTSGQQGNAISGEGRSR